MRTVLFVVSILITISITTYVQGTECFNCIYYDSNFPLYFDPRLTEDPSCARGSIPDERLKMNCSEVSFRGGAEGENSTYTCMDLSMDGLYNLSPTFYWNGTLRTCVQSFKDDGAVFTEECLDGKLGKVAFFATNPEIKEILTDFTGYFNEVYTDAHICNCNDDMCNGDQ